MPVFVLSALILSSRIWENVLAGLVHSTALKRLRCSAA